MILVIALDLAGCSVEREHRRSEKIVSGPLITHPWSAIPGAPKGEVRCRVVSAGDPHRPAAGFPLIAGRPRLRAGLARPGHRVGLPRRLAGLGVECRDETADT